MTNTEALEIATGGLITSHTICPWQEIRQIGNVHWQIDLLLTPSELYEYKWTDMYVDLQQFFLGREHMMTLPNKFNTKIHSAAGLNLYTRFSMLYDYKKGNVIIPNLPLSRGWIYEIMDKGLDFVTATRMLSTGQIELSGAMFCKPK